VPFAVLLFAVYAGLLTSGRTWLERGETPAWMGLWWVHAAVLALSVVLVALPPAAARWRARAARPTSST